MINHGMTKIARKLRSARVAVVRNVQRIHSRAKRINPTVLLQK